MGAVQDSYITIAWLVLLVVLLVIEIITVGLTTIWGAGGALAALILNILCYQLFYRVIPARPEKLDVPFAGQVVTFFVVTILLLVFTRPFAMRFINTRRLKTNYEGIIGKTIRISQKVDNIGQTGMAVVNGTEWTVRSEQDDVILEPGTLAKVVNISGVKLIVQKYEED